MHSGCNQNQDEENKLYDDFGGFQESDGGLLKRSKDSKLIIPKLCIYGIKYHDSIPQSVI